MDLSKCNSLDELEKEIFSIRNENKELKDKLENKNK